MATQTIHFESLPGVTAVKLFVPGDDTVVAEGASIAQGTNDPVHGTCEVEDVPAGTYKVVCFISSIPVSFQYVDLDEETGEYFCRGSIEADVRTSTRSTFNAGSDKVTVATNEDKTGYALAADQAVNVTKVNGNAVSGVDDFKADVSGLATAANLATVDDVVDAIKAKTDKLDFTGSDGMLKSESTNMRGTDNAVTSLDGIATSQDVSDATSTITGAISGLNDLNASDVQSSAEAALAEYNAAQKSDVPSASTIASAVWANGTRTLSSFGTLVDDVAQAVWSYTTRSLTTFGMLASSIVENVWEYTTRTLTAFSFTPSINSTQFDQLAKTSDLPADFSTVGVSDGKIDANAEVNLTPEQIEQIGDEIGQVIAGGITVSGLSPAARQQLAGTVIRLQVPAWTVDGFDQGIIAGDAYKDGREWVLTIEGYEGPDLENADRIVMHGTNCDDEFDWEFVADSIGDGIVTLTASLDSEDTDIPKGAWKVHLFAEFGDDRISLIGPNAKLKVTGV